MTNMVTTKSKHMDKGHCHRCGGLMVREKVFELSSFDWHCVSCGERIDPVILAHRQVLQSNDLVREQAAIVFTEKGKAC